VLNGSEEKMKTITRGLLPLAVVWLDVPAFAHASESSHTLEVGQAFVTGLTNPSPEKGQAVEYSSGVMSRKVFGGTNADIIPIGASSTTATLPGASVGDRFRLALADNDGSTSSPSSRKRSTRSADDKGTLEEIVVTAQKRDERLMDVPVSITAISGERLDELQVNSLSDLAGYVPGMTVLSGGRPGDRQLILRGLSTGLSVTTPSLVGTYVDDIPIGSSGPAGRPGMWGLDLMPYDFSGVEVLKGPQGTLYGSNSMGGLLKYTLRKPSLTEFEARVGSNVETVDYSDDGPTWAARAMVGAPIVEGKLGVRLSGFYRDNSGYTDNWLTQEDDVDSSKQKGGLALALWQPTETIAVRATVMAQNVDSASNSVVDIDPVTQRPLYGRYTNSAYLATPTVSETLLYAIGVDWDLSFGRVSSSTSWSQLTSEYSDDLTPFFGPLCAAFCPDYPFADALARFDGTIETKKFTQEVRLASIKDQKVQWMVGGYYTNEDVLETQSLPTLTPSGDQLPDRNNLFTLVSDGDYEEAAAFVNGRFKFTDRFDVGGGLRYSRYELQNYFSPTGGPFGAGSVAETRKLDTQNVTTWMADARYFLDPKVMFYGRVATGYRPGNQGVVIPAIGYSGTVKADHTRNYELGLKGEFSEQNLAFDVSLYSVDWTDIQINQVLSGLSVGANGGEARSKGVELSVTYLPIQSLQVTSGVTYTDAELTQDAPGVGGLDGDQLPGSPEWAGSVTVDYRRLLGYETELLLGSGYRYRGAVPAGFGVNRVQLDSQETVDAYVGVNVDAAEIKLYAKNVFNDYSYVNGYASRRFASIPRTFILSVDYSF
jgi:iron complex outermembrane receptor protein